MTDRIRTFNSHPSEEEVRASNQSLGYIPKPDPTTHTYDRMTPPFRDQRSRSGSVNY